jgi:hypothetical protein
LENIVAAHIEVAAGVWGLVQVAVAPEHTGVEVVHTVVAVAQPGEPAEPAYIVEALAHIAAELVAESAAHIVVAVVVPVVAAAEHTEDVPVVA